MTPPADRTEAAFAAAAALADPADRAAYLDQACAGAPALRARVEALLHAHDQTGHLLDRPAAVAADGTADFPPADAPPGEAAGAVVGGRYTLLEPLGEGGMGAVFLAEQQEPMRRRVALK